MPEHAIIPQDEDGSKLWLRYARVADKTLLESYRQTIRQIILSDASHTLQRIASELKFALPQLIDRDVPVGKTLSQPGALVVGTPMSLPAIAALGWEPELTDLGPEGFVIRSISIAGNPATVIASIGEAGALYGAFHFLRLMQTNQRITALAIAQKPRIQLRLLDHWDNLDGSIERGYAGKSMWRWDELPEKLDPRYAHYARACASIGINGAVINNVNANPLSLSPEYLQKSKALADVWRPYGIRVYLSANFASPKRLGNLATADPLDADVMRWWRAKADAIYSLIPDFGGFVVKANSEGQPGPHDYGRSHADGANCLADALAPHGGIVMWRAFVYDEKVDPDRAKRAYIEFTALDGKFRPNVMVQVKNGPIDFQPREPFHPLFGAMTKTPVMAELQITQEYLGFSNHLVFLASMWQEFLESDTFARGKGSTVARTIDGSIYPLRPTGMCAVANTGSDTNWCGHHFAQANWYAFGRLAWDHDLTAEQIADEWIRMTWTSEPGDIATIKKIMLESWEAIVSYSMPLGLHHLIGGDHYAPMPWNTKDRRPDWTASYYHQADASAIGFDRTMSGDKAVGQYFPPVRDQFDSLQSCPEKFLLWFHRLPWDYKMKSGHTLWDEICAKYRSGATQAKQMQATWQSLEGQIDARRYREVAAKLAIQANDAREWSEKCIEFFDSARQGRMNH